MSHVVNVFLPKSTFAQMHQRLAHVWMELIVGRPDMCRRYTNHRTINTSIHFSAFPREENLWIQRCSGTEEDAALEMGKWLTRVENEETGCYSSAFREPHHAVEWAVLFYKFDKAAVGGAQLC